MHDQAIERSEDQLLCTLTKRVMIISPLPERVKQLFVSLSTACFDVFSLHEFNEDMLSSVKPELVIYDALPTAVTASYTDVLERGHSLLGNVSSYHISLVILMDEQTYERKEQLELAGAEIMIWPSSVDQALERINRLLENQSQFSKFEDLIVFKDLKVNTRKMIVTKDNLRIELTKTEYDLLLHFLTSDGAVQTREVLLDVIWGLQFYAGSNVVDVHIKSLRKKLEDSAVDPKYIATVRGVGYRLADRD
ncbi:MAG: response regulator transcription factor [Candidatus Pristimantibacillus lignocellulolyticus]|uniref:Response regulator transcription factor n=1 Tax=Candidatus Pristimantibacillus lignocellulolyticus TaxID=2994561 RepID=A0A9J6ZIL6_9BACL|nr:MAG: response regulator transcription factor [Candidatus Pristimantibacillus lignocellulolyticus]